MSHPRVIQAVLAAALVLSGCTTVGAPTVGVSPSPLQTASAPTAGTESVPGGQLLRSAILGISLLVPTELTLLEKAKLNDPAMDPYWKQMSTLTGISTETLKASVAGTEGYATDPDGSGLVLYDTKQSAIPTKELLKAGLGGQLKIKDLHIEATDTSVGTGWKASGTLTVGEVSLHQYYLYAKGPGTAFSLTFTSRSRATAQKLYDKVVATIGAIA